MPKIFKAVVKISADFDLKILLISKMAIFKLLHDLMKFKKPKSFLVFLIPQVKKKLKNATKNSHDNITLILTTKMTPKWKNSITTVMFWCDWYNNHTLMFIHKLYYFFFALVIVSVFLLAYNWHKDYEFDTNPLSQKLEKQIFEKSNKHDNCSEPILVLIWMCLWL